LASLLAAAPTGAQVRVQPVAETGIAVGGQAGAAGTGSIQNSGTSLNLKAPSLVPTLQAPLTPAVNTPAGHQAAAQPVLPSDLAAPLANATALPASTIKPAKGLSPVQSGMVLPAVDAGAAKEKRGVHGEDGGANAEQTSALSGRIMFDGAAPKTPGIIGSLRQRVGKWFEKPDTAPAFPGQAGATGRIGGKTYRLGSKIGDYNGAAKGYERYAKMFPDKEDAAGMPNLCM